MCTVSVIPLYVAGAHVDANHPMGPTAGTDRDEARRAERRLAEEVLPAFT